MIGSVSSFGHFLWENNDSLMQLFLWKSRNVKANEQQPLPHASPSVCSSGQKAHPIITSIITLKTQRQRARVIVRLSEPMA